MKMDWRDMMLRRLLAILPLLALLLCTATLAGAADGYWSIIQLPETGADPQINNSGEIVWDSGTGQIYSSVRGQLSASGTAPHLANSGEVVYAEYFGGPNWDLVSTTRGRLTTGGIIDINASGFGVNALGEVVFAITTNGYAQIYSTVRGQITTDAANHWSPCINDHGEIVWNQYGASTALAVSSTRGSLGPCYFLQGLNNSGDYCYSDFAAATNQPGYTTYPHIFSSLHGVIINDSAQYQFEGDLNDAGTIVWSGSDGLYEGQWYPTPVLSQTSLFGLRYVTWPTNNNGSDFHVQYTTNLAQPNWQAMTGPVNTIGTNFYKPLFSDIVVTNIFFRLSNTAP